jgi:hypothetical protein
MSASVVVTVDHRVVFGKLEQAGLLDTGDWVSPAAPAAWPACTASCRR